MSEGQKPAVDLASRIRLAVQEVCAGEAGAFDRLHELLDASLRAFVARRIRLHSDAETVIEISQQAWVAAWKALESNKYRSEVAAFNTFLYAIAHKLMLKHRGQLARNRVGSLASDAAEQIAEVSREAAEELHVAHLLDCTRQILRDPSSAGLSSQETEVLSGLLEGATERSLSARLGAAASTVHARKQSAFAKIRQALTSAGFSEEDIERMGGFGE
jgi:RNA polymerase sigma factor (sigma-70 family)